MTGCLSMELSSLALAEQLSALTPFMRRSGFWVKSCHSRSASSQSVSLLCRQQAAQADLLLQCPTGPTGPTV